MGPDIGILMLIVRRKRKEALSLKMLPNAFLLVGAPPNGLTHG